MRARIQGALRRLERMVSFWLPHKQGVVYWEERAARLGRRAVIDVGHGEEEFEDVTRMQEEQLFPRLGALLTGAEATLLDFGCGPGRFAPGLAELSGAHVVAVDPIAALLELAPAHPHVEYRRLAQRRIPLDDGVADVVWICLVLGGITQAAELAETLEEIDRVLGAEGLLFLVENTEQARDGPHWVQRPVDAYRELLDFVDLEHLGEYRDLDAVVSILAGRRKGAGRRG